MCALVTTLRVGCSACSKRQDELEKVWWEEQAELGAWSAPAQKAGPAAPIPDAEEASAGWQVSS